LTFVGDAELHGASLLIVALLGDLKPLKVTVKRHLVHWL